LTENILITSLRRSGGTLVQRLLDHHPECSVFPFEYVFSTRKREFSWTSNLAFPLLSPEKKLWACGLGISLAKKLDRCHPDRDDDAAYRSELLALASRSRSVAAFYSRSAEAYFRRYQGGGLRSKLVNHLPNLCALSALKLHRTFGRHRAILTIRDPRAVFVSLVNKRNTIYTDDVIPDLCRDWRQCVEEQHLGDPDVISFRFEDLVHHPESIMTSVADRLGIRFEACLLQPTRVGQPIRANTSFARTPEIDPSAADSWKTELADGPRREIEARLGPLMEQLGYL
jgi:hypothetical protein